MSKDKFLTTKEVAELLKINEKKVYILAQEGKIPATKITGKWLFPENELITYLKFNSLKNIKKGITLELLNQNILLGAGSDDPILSKIFSKFYKNNNSFLFYTIVGSKNGIDFLKNRIVHFCFSHLYDASTKEFNIPFLNEDYVVLKFFNRNIGIVSCEELRKENLNKKKFTFVLRQKGSGIRAITEFFFESGVLNKNNLSFYKEEVSTHMDVARLVKENENFIGITTEATAKLFGLNFLKLFEERFDFITLKDYFFKKQIQNFLEFLRNDIYKDFKSIEGYNFQEIGKIIC